MRLVLIVEFNLARKFYICGNKVHFSVQFRSIAIASNDFISGRWKGRSEMGEIQPWIDQNNLLSLKPQPLQSIEKPISTELVLSAQKVGGHCIRDIILVYIHVKYHSELISHVILQQRFNHAQLKGISFWIQDPSSLFSCN